MAAIGGNTIGPGDAVVNVYINHEKKFAFVEMKSVEKASIAMDLDEVEAQYNGPRIEGEVVTLQFVKKMLDDFKNQKCLHKRYAYQIILQAREMLRAMSSLMDITIPDGHHFTVCGDVHGQRLMGSKWEIKLSQLDVQTMQGVSQPRPEQESVLLHAQQQVALQDYGRPGGIYMQYPAAASKSLHASPTTCQYEAWSDILNVTAVFG
ncbi:Serine/threonine-protein phosphatase 5 [Platanthera zijinensis]|uniref:protein-serine/threonine phosphatase n=1 Tax=Platanthera zijinensis TaxID=2320716 RepID=A0AAP0BHU0_9ASPA